MSALQPDIHLFGHTHFAVDDTLGGVRYIQAPLCSPLERQRRLRTIGFETSMAAALEDPVAAKWLPVCVYETLATPQQLTELGRGRQGDAVLLRLAAEQALEESMGGSADASPASSSSTTASSSNGYAGSSDSEDGRLLLVDEQAHGVAASDTESESEPPEAQDAAGSLIRGGSSSSPPSSRSSSSSNSRTTAASAAQQGAWEAAGMLPLRHGAMPPPLGAHWSSYYQRFARRPEITTLAPWVAPRYKKRRQRQAARSGGSFSGGGGGSQDSADGDP